MLANDGGLLCHASNLEIAKAAGCSPAMVREALSGLVSDRVFEVFDWRDGISTRFIVLRDHPEADAFIAEVREIYGPHSRRAKDV